MNCVACCCGCCSHSCFDECARILVICCAHVPLGHVYSLLFPFGLERCQFLTIFLFVGSGPTFEARPVSPVLWRFGPQSPVGGHGFVHRALSAAEAPAATILLPNGCSQALGGRVHHRRQVGARSLLFRLGRDSSVYEWHGGAHSCARFSIVLLGCSESLLIVPSTFDIHTVHSVLQRFRRGVILHVLSVVSGKGLANHSKFLSGTSLATSSRNRSYSSTWA